MNDAPNFASILDEAPTEISRPKPLPVGTYLCVVQGQPVYDKSNKKGTPFVEFTLRPITAEEDVDADDLAEMGGIGDKTIKATFYLTDDAVFRLDEFHQHCGIDINEPASRRSRNEAIVNAQVRAVIKHEMSQDATQSFARLSRTAVAD
jgi:hypothetical protein